MNEALYSPKLQALNRQKEMEYTAQSPQLREPKGQRRQKREVLQTHSVYDDGNLQSTSKVFVCNPMKSKCETTVHDYIPCGDRDGHLLEFQNKKVTELHNQVENMKMEISHWQTENERLKADVKDKINILSDLENNKLERERSWLKKTMTRSVCWNMTNIFSENSK